MVISKNGKKTFFMPREKNGQFMAYKKAQRLGLLRQFSKKIVTSGRLKQSKLTVKNNPMPSNPTIIFGKDHNTAQIYSTGMEFAFASKPKPNTYQQIHTFVLCKDFLHDLVWAFLNKTKWSIYGFSYNYHKNLPLDTDNTSFLFRDKTKKATPESFHAKREACQQFLNSFEEQAGFAPTQIFPVEHEHAPCWLILGDKAWQHAPTMVGLYTLLIRVGTAHTLGETHRQTLEKIWEDKLKLTNKYGEAGGNDPSYLKNSRLLVEKVLECGNDIFYPSIEENYPVELPYKLSLHNSLGPVAFSNALKMLEQNLNTGLAKAMPHWFRPEIWGKKQPSKK